MVSGSQGLTHSSVHTPGLLGTSLSLHGCWQRALAVLLAVTILGLTCK